MLPDGYIDARFSYGCTQADSKLVAFKNIKTPLLSVNVLQQLKIVLIHLTESVSPPEQAHTSLNRASLSDSSILFPFDSNHVFLSAELHCCSKTNDARIPDAELLRQRLLEELHDVFESQPSMKGEQLNIVLKKNAVRCCVSKSRPIPIAYQQALKNELDELLREGVITPVTEATEWVNPIVVEPKRDRNGQYNGKIRLCVDLRHLNKCCVRERYQSPSVLEVVQSIQADHASLFFTFDAWKGYHQIELAQKSKNLTTF